MATASTESPATGMEVNGNPELTRLGADQAQTVDQGGDELFINRFALRGVDAPFDAAEAMRSSLAHQNPLHVVALPRDQLGPLATPSESLLSVSSDQVVVTAFKPAEDQGHGFVVRAWELGGLPRAFNIDTSAMGTSRAWHTNLVETDIAPTTVANGVISAAATANEITTYRFINDLIFADGFEGGDTSGWTVVVP